MPSSMSDKPPITITVRLYSILRQRDGRIVDQLELEMPGDCRVSMVLSDLDVPGDLQLVLAVNDQIVTESTPLAEGDCLAIIPAVAGGDSKAHGV
jgi:molybdopterin converting factor small subunit